MLITPQSCSLVHMRTKPVPAELCVVHNLINYFFYGVSLNFFFCFFSLCISYNHVIIYGLKCDKEFNLGYLNHIFHLMSCYALWSLKRIQTLNCSLVKSSSCYSNSNSNVIFCSERKTVVLSHAQVNGTMLVLFCQS